jgi:hypothetical protein
MIETIIDILEENDCEEQLDAAYNLRNLIGEIENGEQYCEGE